MAEYQILIDGNPYDPTNFGTVKIQLEKTTEYGGYYFRRRLTDSLVFFRSAYDYILAQTTVAQCQTITIDIQQMCSGVWVTIMSGYFNRQAVKFYRDKCRCEVEIELDDAYTCLDLKGTDGVNILDEPNPEDYPYVPVFGLQVVANQSTAPCPSMALPDFGDPYALGVYPAGGNDYCFYARYVTRTYCVAGIAQEPPPAATAWNLLSNDCAINGTATWWREATPPEILLSFFDDVCLGIGCVPTVCASFCIDAGTFPNNPLFGVGNTRLCACPTYNQYLLRNGRNLVNVINYILSIVCPGITLRSELLTNNINPVTAVTPNPLQYLTIHQKSDIVNATSSELASVGTISIFDLLDDISKLLNAKWYIDTATNELVFEHITGILSPTIGVDLTTLDSGKWAAGRNTYNFDRDQVPRSETFTYANNAQQIDFAGLPITYDPTCATGEEIKTRTQFLETELTRIFQNQNEGLEGFVLIANASILQDDLADEVGELSQLFIPNAPLSWANLHRDYFLDYRYLDAGNLNGAATVFNSTRPIKKQEGVIFPLECLDSFDPLQLVRTELGDGRVETAEYDLASRKITVTLKFEDL